MATVKCLDGELGSSISRYHLSLLSLDRARQGVETGRGPAVCRGWLLLLGVCVYACAHVCLGGVGSHRAAPRN